MTRTSGSTGFLALLGLGALSLSGAGLSLSCTDDESCALNEKCSSSTARCTCSPGWSGATCEQLAVQPAQPLPQGYGVSPNLTSWGGSVVAYGGEFHMFVSEIIQSCGMDCYVRNSRATHAVSSRSEGPFRFADVALEVFSTSPQVMLDASDAASPVFALFTVGNGSHTVPSANCTIGEELATRDCTPPKGWQPGSGPGRLHLARSPAGPWRAVGDPLPLCNNPATMRDSNGTWFLLCGSRSFELYHAPSLEGPWMLAVAFSPITGKLGPHFSGAPGPLALAGCNRATDGCAIEDPFLWQDAHQHWHVIFHAFDAAAEDRMGGLVSMHIFSRDGLTWHRSKVPPYTNTVQWAGDTSNASTVVATRERPKLLIGKDGELTHLITAVCSVSACGLTTPVDCKGKHHDYTLVQPVVTSALKTDDYAADGENFQCRRSFGATGPDYPLPCRAPAGEYTSPASREFVITAWWAPLVASSDAHGSMDQLQEYKAAGFNAVRTSNVAGFCQYLNVTPTPATANEVFDCIAGAAERIERAGLLSIFAPGHWEVTETLVGATFGGSSALGGLSSSLPNSAKFDSPFPGGSHSVNGVAPSDGPDLITTQELAWIKDQATTRNLSFAAVFLHDDSFSISADTTAQSQWLSRHWAASPGMTNGGTSDPVGLYRARQFVLSPEEYSVHGESGGNATQMAYSQMMMYRTNAYASQRYRLLSWPIFALGDGGFIKDITSDSLIYVQVYSALAFGSKGLDYYCWGNAIWRMLDVNGSSFAKGEKMSSYPFVAAANTDAQRWGNRLFNATHHGVISTFFGSHNDTEMPSHHRPLPHDRLGPAPAAGLPVAAMATNLIVGVFSDSRVSESGFLMVVDCRVSLTAGELLHRTVSITVAPSCRPTLVPGGSDAWPRSAFEWSRGNNTVKLTLVAGAGALLRVEGDGCGNSLRSVQSWVLQPRRVSMSDFNPLPPVDGGVGTEIYVHTMDDSARLAVSAAGGGLKDRSMIIGASYHEPTHGIPSLLAARQLAEAGFSVISLDATNLNATAQGLMWAAAYGFSVLGRVSAPALLAANRASQISSVVYDAVDQLACHTNLGGLLLSTTSGDQHQQQQVTTSDAVAFVQAMRSVQHWGVPLVGAERSVSSAADVVRLAATGLPLAAVNVPLASGQAILNLYRSLSLALDDSSVAATPTLAIPVCASNSDSFLRFAAFSSLWFAFRADGYQNLGALWFDGVGACAPVESGKFNLLASINTRITQRQWSYAFARRTHGSTARIWSTSTLNVSGGSLVPGSVEGGLILSMDKDLLVMELNSSVIYVLSTDLSTLAGGAPAREVRIMTDPNVSWTHAMEGNLFEGEAACDTRREGNRLLLRLPGGSGQLVSFGRDALPTKQLTKLGRPRGFGNGV
jgi:hypothetical protein